MSAPFVVIGRALFAVPLMYVGYSVQKYHAIFFDNEKVSFIWAGIFGTVAVALTLLFRGISPYDLNHLYIPKPHIIYLLGITGSLFVLTLSYGLTKIGSHFFSGKMLTMLHGNYVCTLSFEAVYRFFLVCFIENRE